MKFRFPFGVHVTCSLTLLVLLVISILLNGCSLDLGGAPPSNSGGNSSGSFAGAPTTTPTSPGRPIRVRVEDEATGKPVVGASLNAAGTQGVTGADGSYLFADLAKGTKLQVSAVGYTQGSVDTGTTNEVSVTLHPNSISGRVTDASTGKALVGVLVKLSMPGTDPQSGVSAVTATLTVSSTAVPAATGTPAGVGRVGLEAPNLQSDKSITPTLAVEVVSSPTSPEGVTSTPLPPTPSPTPVPVPPTGPGFIAVYTGDDGTYFFKDVPAGSNLTFKMPGYKIVKQSTGDGPRKDVALQPFKAQAIYITANIASSKDLYDPLIDFVTKSKVNAVVLNVQTDSSQWVFDIKNKDAIAAGNTDEFLKEMPEIVRSLKQKGIYTIARVVTFQEAKMADARPDWAVKSSVTGKPWKGGYAGQQRWLDASNPAVQDHLVEMTKEVLGLGFDEIQYDYVRFPSDPAPSEPGKPVFYEPLTDKTKPLAIEKFLTKVHAVIEPSDAFMSIDIFGYTIWPDQDGKPLNGVIGQVFEHMVDHTDYVCPMIYPSHFTSGEQGCTRPETCAYKIIHKAGEFAQSRFAGKKAKYRPWLQDFDWGKTDYTSPGTTKVIEQIRANEEMGGWGWQMWDAANDYEPRAAFKK